MTHLDQLESQSVYILREAFNRIEKLAMLWSLGKDSNVMVWLAKKAFFGHVPFPVMHVDTGKKFRAMYEFRDRYAKEWKLNLIVEDCPPYEATDPTLPVNARWGQRKTLGLRAAIAKHGFTGIIAGIRRDEEATRAKERVFSPRGDSGQWDFKDQPPEFWDQFNTDLPKGTHLRVHPLLHWTEIDIWRYIRREGIPVIDLYFAPGPGGRGRGSGKPGKRYRSLGDEDITFPIDSNATTLDEVITELESTKTSERAGRAMDRETEDAFERLRAEGYM
jgi:sulfate adenylyltransferase subunit 2